jgi:hypothetical protein
MIAASAGCHTVHHPDTSSRSQAMFIGRNGPDDAMISAPAALLLAASTSLCRSVMPWQPLGASDALMVVQDTAALQSGTCQFTAESGDDDAS